MLIVDFDFEKFLGMIFKVMLVVFKVFLMFMVLLGSENVINDCVKLDFLFLKLKIGDDVYFVKFEDLYS